MSNTLPPTGRRFHSESHIPRTPGAIERPRLLGQLQVATDHKLTLISAPPGFGKTTLASQYVQAVPLPVAWHSVEDRERDLPALYAHALSALDDISPGIAEALPQAAILPAESATRIGDVLRDTLPGDALYVLDDVHRLGGSRGAEEWLRALINALPSTCHVLLISRTLPNLPFAEMIARGEVLAIGQDQLRFTADETCALAETMAEQPVRPEDIDQIMARLEGWPAGTMLALHPLPVPLERGLLKGGAGPSALFDVLADGMVRAQPPGLLRFLLRSSILTRLTPELCQSALGLPDSAEWLHMAQERNLFLSRVAGGLVYHTLFRDFLQRQLRADDPDLFYILHARAAAWFEQRGDIDAAFEHYLAAGKTDRAMALAEANATLCEAEGHHETLLRWRERLAEFGAASPVVSFKCSQVYSLRYEYQQAEAALEEAHLLFTERRDETGLLRVMLQRAMLHRFQSRYQAAAALAEQVIGLAHGSEANLRGRALRILGFSKVRLGHQQEGIDLLEEALPLYRAEGDTNALIQILFDLQVAYTQVGRLDDAGVCLHEIVAMRRKLGSAVALATALNNLGNYYHQRGDYEQARQSFQEGLGTIAHAPEKRSETFLLWSAGDLERDLGNFDEARRLYLQALEVLAGNEPYLHSAILNSFSTLRRWQGRRQEAIALAEEAADIARTFAIALQDAAAQTALWGARALSGEASTALPSLRAALAQLESQQAWFDLAGALAVCAQADLLSGNHAAAQRDLWQAVQIAERIGSAQRLAAEIIAAPELEQHVINGPVASRLLSQDLERLRQAQAKLRVQHDHPARASHTYSLSVVTLGQESIDRDGVVIPPSEWRSATARDLFLYLLFNGPTSREEISLAFWPESGPQQMRSIFHTTLYRARHALGENVILFEHELYQTNPELDIWCDAQEMLSLARRAQMLSPRDARTEDLWRRAAELYRGKFLPSLYADWALLLQDTFQETYLKALHGLAECAKTRRDYSRAVTFLKRATAVEPYREELHRAILTCYAELGEKQQVAAYFDALRELFRRELRFDPSDETAELVRRLLN